MRTTLYLVRHGETEYNRLRIMQGRRINAPLNDTGRRQAAALGRRLAAVPFDAAYTSTLDRAIETAAIVLSDRPGIPVTRRPELDEMSWGVYEGEPDSESLREALNGIFRQWDQGAFDYAIEGGESIRDVEARARRALEDIVAQHPGETVLVVAHGRLLRVLLASVLAGYGLARMGDIGHANTSVNRLVWTDGRFEAELLNCTVHLEAFEAHLME